MLTHGHGNGAYAHYSTALCLPTRTSQSRLFAVSSERSSGPLSNSPGRPAVPLPKRLYLQLNNSAMDNKNRFVMAICSLLTTRGIFKEVTEGFLVVGHTHEDIDAYFSYLSKLLK
jgi:hypothetical protein